MYMLLLLTSELARNVAFVRVRPLCQKGSLMKKMKVAGMRRYVSCRPFSLLRYLFQAASVPKQSAAKIFNLQLLRLAQGYSRREACKHRATVLSRSSLYLPC